MTQNPYLCRQTVFPKQYVFLTHPSPEMLFGGSAGSGKSRVLLCAALQFVQWPGYSALLLRRTFQDLKQSGALFDLAHEILRDTNAKWNGGDYIWHFPNGSRLAFGYLDTEADKYRYAGSAWQFLGFDELTQFTDSQYLFLQSRLRRPTGMGVPLRTRGATNPGGPGHSWVKARFIDPKTRDPQTVFIPAKGNENTFLDYKSYVLKLNNLHLVERAQLRDGNWDIQAQGNVFKAEWFRYWTSDHQDFYQLGERRVPKSECVRFASADIAGTEEQDHTDPDYTVIQCWDCTPTGDLILVEQWRGKMEIPDVEEKLLALAWEWDVDYCAVEKNGIGLPVVQAAKRRGLAVKAILAKRSKYARAQAASIRVEAGTVWFPRHAPWREELESELLSFPLDGVHDDQVDAISTACQHMQKQNVHRDSRDDARDKKEVDAVEAAEKEREKEELERLREEVEGDLAWTQIA